MAETTIGNLTLGAVDGTSMFEQERTVNGSQVSEKVLSSSVANFVGTSHQFAGLSTTAKNLVGAINEAASSGGASVVQLTQAEYDLLTTEQKMNGSIYKLTDKAIFYCLDEEYHAVKELTSAQYEALTSAQQNNGTIYIQTDAETTGSDIPVSDSDSTSIAKAIRKSGSVAIASPRLSIASQSGSYYRVGDFVVVKITVVFGNDGQNSGLYLNDIRLDGVIFLSQKTLGFMGVDNDLYELETLNNENMWVYKNGTRINANTLNGKTAYITIHAAL